MKKLLSIIIVLAVTAPFFTSCKKGENDPGISLKSRTSRLTGEWELTDMEGTYTSGTSTSTFTFNGTTYTSYYSGGFSTSIYSETIEFIKDGTYESTTTDNDDGYINTDTDEGTWAWIGGNKEDEMKNKERLSTKSTKSTSSWSYDGSSGMSSSNYDGDAESVSVWRIDQLSSKILVVTIDYTSTGVNQNGDAWNESLEVTGTYEKQ